MDAPEQSDKYGRLARHGFIEYDRKLTEQEASNFELKLIPTEADLDVLAKTVVSDSMANYAQQYVEMAESDPATFGSQVKLNTKKAAPNIAYPEGDDLDYFMEKVKAELVSQTPPTPPQTNEETPVVSEADTAANDALSYLDAVMQLQSKDIAEIRDARNKVRGTIAALQNAGRFDENEDKVNAAAQHLSDLLVAIQREGAWSMNLSALERLDLNDRLDELMVQATTAKGLDLLDLNDEIDAILVKLGYGTESIPADPAEDNTPSIVKDFLSGKFVKTGPNGFCGYASPGR
ncbi:Uncharacterised protein [Citrobacter freundii]|nr:Uncharacterised protein [Citrobacter freundii]